jgi:hypothetical protein
VKLQKLIKESAKVKKTNGCFRASLKPAAAIARFTRDFTGLFDPCPSCLTYDVSGENNLVNWETAPTNLSQSTQHLVHHAIIPPLSPHF